MLNSSSSSFSRRPSRGFLVALAVGVVCAIPWSVTAQSPSSTKSTNHKQVVHIKKHSKSKQRRLIAIKTKAHSVRGTGSNHADTAKRASGLPMRSQVGFGVRLASPTAPVATGLASARQVVAGTTPIGTSSAAVPSVPLAGWSRPAQTGSATAGVIGTTSIPASPTGVVAGVGIGTTAAPVLLQVGSAAGASPTTRASVPAGQVIGQNIAAGVTPAVPGQNTWTAPRVGQFPSTSSAMAGSPFAVPAVHSGRLGFGVTPWASTRRGTIQVALTGRRGELTVHLDNASLRDAIIQLFDRAGKNYVLKGDIVGTATVSLHNLPFDSILRALLHAGPIPLTFRVDSGVYTISSTK